MSSIEIKNNFDIDDIHRIREENYERQKNMTMEEAIADNEERFLKIKEEFLKKGIKL